MAIFLELTSAKWSDVETTNGMSFSVEYDGQSSKLKFYGSDKNQECQTLKQSWKSWSELCELANQLYLQWCIVSHLTPACLTGVSLLYSLKFNIYSGSYSNKIGEGIMEFNTLTITLKTASAQLNNMARCQELDRGIILRLVNDLISVHKQTGGFLD